MDKQQQIRSAIQKLTEPETATILAKVVSVDESELTIVLADALTGVEVHDVRLRPVIDGKQFITIIPKVGTWCLAVRIEDESEWMIVSVGEADKFFIKIGSTEFKMDATGFEISKGADTLKQVFTLLIEAVMQIVVMQGNNPNYVKLQKALLKVNNLLP